MARLDGDEKQVDERAVLGSHSFFGAFSYAIDSKGRTVIPTTYRDALGDTFTMAVTRDFNAIALYPNAVYDKLLTELESMNKRKPVVQKYTDEFYKWTYRDMSHDGQGRIQIPAMLRQLMLGEEKELEISGALNHIRIVGSQKARTEDINFMKNIDTILEEIGNLGD